MKGKKKGSGLQEERGVRRGSDRGCCSPVAPPAPQEGASPAAAPFELEGNVCPVTQGTGAGPQ